MLCIVVHAAIPPHATQCATCASVRPACCAAWPGARTVAAAASLTISARKLARCALSTTQTAVDDDAPRARSLLATRVTRATIRARVRPCDHGLLMLLFPCCLLALQQGPTFHAPRCIGRHPPPLSASVARRCVLHAAAVRRRGDRHRRAGSVIAAAPLTSHDPHPLSADVTHAAPHEWATPHRPAHARASNCGRAQRTANHCNPLP
jgi:hypothetical protein